MQDDSPGVEFGLPVSGNGDADGDRDHVTHSVTLKGLLFKHDPDRVDGDGHKGFEHLDKGDGEVNVSGVGEPEAEGIQSADGDDGGEVEIARHGDGFDEFEDFDEEESEGGAKGHVDHR